MRTVASYALESTSGNPVADFAEVCGAVEEWLIDKGWREGSEGQFVNTQGNKTRVGRIDQKPPSGEIRRCIVAEDLAEAVFATEVTVVHDENSCAVFVELRVGGAGPRLQPFRFDARRPKFLGRLLSSSLKWHLGETPLTDRAYDFVGSIGGLRAVDILWHAERAVPVVMVSLVHGAGITSNFVTKLAGDLAGLAIVATLDDEASWAVTKRKGAEWSCFNGAVRLYWPFSPGASQPRLHPLWLRASIIGHGTDPSNASYRMRAQLRRIILGVSALSVRKPSLVRKMDRAVQQQRQDDLKAALQSSRGVDDYREIAESYAADNDRLREDLRQKEDQLSMLEDQVAELQLALRYIPQDVEAEVPPDVEAEPVSVAEAVAAARAKFADRLMFSESIEDGVRGLNQDAGPPSKILHHLRVLHELAAAREAGGLGIGIVAWLAERGVTCSIESETVRNGGGRQWIVNDERVSFDYHLKPSDNVPPDRCVRIYFDLVDGGAARIGWIGRHPD